MPNGGHICCHYCKFANESHAKCVLYGTPLDIDVLCRHFTMTGGTERFKEYLATLELNVIYKVDIEPGDSPPHDPRPIYRIKVEAIKE